MAEITVAVETVPEGREAVLVTWLFENGAIVSAGEPVAEIMLEKATIEIVAPQSGRLRHRKNAEDVVMAGDILAIVD
ncbi:MAG: lipoyl domain-containing protein [Gammaproteobacteria bacterium]